MVTLACQKVLLCSGCCTFSVNMICLAWTSMSILVKAASSSTIQRCKTCLPRRDAQSSPQALMIPNRMDLSSKAITRLPTLCRRFFLVQTLTQSSGPMPSAMLFVCQMPHQNCLNPNLQLHLQPGNKKTSPTQGPLAVVSGFSLQGITLPSFAPTPSKASSLDVSPNKIPYCRKIIIVIVARLGTMVGKAMTAQTLVRGT